MQTPEDQGSFEYQLAGLEREFAEGMARLAKTDAADDHVALYRRSFTRAVRDLRHSIERAGPLGYDVACVAWQVAFLSGLWPVLKEKRVSDTARVQTEALNQTKQSKKNLKRDRCLSIAGSLNKPTAGQVRLKYARKFPKERTPSERSILNYLSDNK